MEGQELRDHVLRTNDEYRHLWLKHKGCEEKLEKLEHRFYLTDSEKLEETILKKQKLQLKDRMQEILHRYREDLAGQPV